MIEDGYRLWLRYDRIADQERLAEYRAACAALACEAPSPSPTLRAAREELEGGLGGLLGTPPASVMGVRAQAGALVVGTPASSPAVAALGLDRDLAALGGEGFLLRRVDVGAGPEAGQATVIAANTDRGVLYGAFAFLRHLQTQRPLRGLAVASTPRLNLRMLDHWDNLDRTVERGYAGFSIWDWHKLPDYVSPQMRDYARANASLGINGVVLTNVNANALVLTAEYLPKVAALADAFRPYGLRVYLTARFSAPIEIGGLATADPLDRRVAGWWSRKAQEIYRHVPDFGGFLVKANSEGQPGPQDYGCTHADGANVLADALAAGGGVVIWRAFVYRSEVDEDRAKQAVLELAPLDGAFRPNVLVQVKNGPIDFQPREPFHPLFGAMPRTPLVAELQITQEYLGFATHLAYLAPLFTEALDADTYAAGPGSTVARAITGMAGVANIGTDRNWCGHPFAQANWHAFGRLAWDPSLRPEALADEWLRMTFGCDERFVAPARAMMLGSREAVVSYMTPLGLHHLMAKDHHYGPGPWVDEGRADWTSVYYHRADAAGVGFDRTAAGSDAISQYAPPWRALWGDRDRCPETLLLWFHHAAWTLLMRSGRTLWDELCAKYQQGVDGVREMRRTWDGLRDFVDGARFEHVRALLAIQEKEAVWWRDACVLYFQTFSKLPLPAGYEPPARTLEELRRVKPSNVPGI
jgi:alpha-glucuronidase